jgi:hypothetical protein
MKTAWIRGAVAGALVASFACSSEPKPAPPTPAPAATVAAPAVTAPPATAPAAVTTAPAAGSIGIPECDSYVTKYEACVNQYVPAAQKAQMQAALDANRNAWKAAAAQPAARATLASTCQQAEAAARAAMSAYQCKW